METNQEIVKMFERKLSKNFASKTITSYVKTIDNMLLFLENKHISEITYSDVENCIEDLKFKRDKFGDKTREENVANTVNQRISAINTFFDYCGKFDWFNKKYHFETWRDFDRMDRKHIRDESQMNEIEWGKIIDINDEYFRTRQSTRNIRDRVIIYLGMKCGLRKGVIARLKNDDITIEDDGEEKIIKIRIKKAKGNKYRNVFLPIKDYSVFNDWDIEKRSKGWDCEYLICTWNNKPIFNDVKGTENNTVLGTIQRCSKRANIIRDGHQLTFKPHQMRHGFVTHALSMPDVSLKDVSEYIGHANIKTTDDIYVHSRSDAPKMRLARTV